MQMLRVLFGAIVLTMMSVAATAEEVNIECSCRISPVNTAPWFNYVVTTTVPDKSNVKTDVLAYVCYQQRSQASNACMEGKDRDSSVQYFKGRLQ
jgi:hypothetical protein